MTQQEVHDLIREHGGIVHGDGNIFFTNAVQFGLVVSAMSQEEALDKSCHMPPIGWRCTRSAGHDGPCAAVACPEDVEFVEKGMRRLREAGISDGQPSQEYAELVLANLDALKDDAAVHIFPSDLHKCETSECVVKVCSVRVGSPDENSVPLFSRDQVAAALADATHTLRMGGKP